MYTICRWYNPFGRAYTFPKDLDAAAHVPKGHAKVIEVPQDWTQCAQKFDVPTHVVAIQWYRETVDSEDLLTNAQCYITSKAST